MKNLAFFNVVIVAAVIIAFTSCSRMEYFPQKNVQTGLASWYGPKFHGNRTSSKEIFNMYDMTAAHRFLPFGTYVMVTNLQNNKSVMVRINDRGPFVRGRIIDLSYAAARAIDMIGSGVVPVRVEILSSADPSRSSGGYSIQVGAFIVKENAVALKNKLSRNYNNVYIDTLKTSRHTYFRVRIRADSMNKATEVARKLQRDGLTAIVFEND